MDDFLLRATVAGLGVAIATGPLGCFVVWRRMAYFGSALSHSALLGVALGALLGVDPDTGVLGVCLLVAAALVVLEKSATLPVDTLLGVLAHVGLAAGLVALAAMPGMRLDLLGYLFGDVLAVGRDDVVAISVLAAGSSVGLALIWRDLLAVTVSEELAEVEGVRVWRVRLAFALLLAVVVAIGMKVVGLLLVVSLLIIPAAAARRLSATPETMAIVATLIGMLSVLAGLAASFRFDLPAGPIIVLAAAAALALTVLRRFPRGEHGAA